MARPRTITDERLFAAAAEVLGRLGPAFTLADVAARAGVAVGTVAHRFGSRSGLLRALSAAAIEQTLTRMDAAAAAAESPVAGLRAALLAWAEPLGDAALAPNHLACLGEDLTDPALRELLGEHHRRVELRVRELLRAAALPRAPGPAQAARLLTALLNGSAIDWSIAPRGRLRTRIAADLDCVLDGWR